MVYFSKLDYSGKWELYINYNKSDIDNAKQIDVHVCVFSLSGTTLNQEVILTWVQGEVWRETHHTIRQGRRPLTLGLQYSD